MFEERQMEERTREDRLLERLGGRIGLGLRPAGLLGASLVVGPWTGGTFR